MPKKTDGTKPNKGHNIHGEPPNPPPDKPPKPDKQKMKEMRSMFMRRSLVAQGIDKETLKNMLDDFEENYDDDNPMSTADVVHGYTHRKLNEHNDKVKVAKDKAHGPKGTGFVDRAK